MMTSAFFGASSYLALGCPSNLPEISPDVLGVPREVSAGASQAVTPSEGRAKRRVSWAESADSTLDESQ